MRHLITFCAATLVVTACNGAGSAPAGPSSPPPSARVAPESPLDIPTEAVQPSGFLMVTKPRLDEMRKQAQLGTKDWKVLLANADEHLGQPRSDRSSVSNFALVYLVTGEEKYARAALAWARDVMKTSDVRSGSYLYFGDIMKPVAVALNWCGAALSAEEKKELADYLARWTQELWHENKGSGWGLADPGNNYHMAFLEGTAFAGYALRQAGDPRGDAFVKLLLEKLEKRGGVLDYLDKRGVGGDWHEGANYGQRSKQRLFQALSVIASMDGKNYFPSRRFFADTIRYALHQTMPGMRLQYPSGDLARDVRSPVSPYDRDYVQMATFWLSDAETRALGQWYLAHVTPSYESDSFNWRGAYHKDLLFALDIPQREPKSQPLFFVSEGTGFVVSRSGWSHDATAVAVSAPKVVDQSHAHHDAGSFTIFKRGWLAVDAVTLSRSGLLWSPAAHNGVSVEGQEQRAREIGGLLHAQDLPGLSYVSVDATGQFTRREAGDSYPLLLDEWTRELVYARPDTVFVYDRIAAKSGRSYDWRVHFATKPRQQGNAFSSENGGGGITMVLLQGSSPKVVSDADIESRAFRVQATAKDGRVLAVLETAAGRAPAPNAQVVKVTKGDAAGAVTPAHAVLFSKKPRGAPLPSSLSYELPGTDKRTHVLVNMADNCDAVVERKGGKTLVTIKPGFTHQRSEHGVITFVN